MKSFQSILFFKLVFFSQPIIFNRSRHRQPTVHTPTASHSPPFAEGSQLHRLDQHLNALLSNVYKGELNFYKVHLTAEARGERMPRRRRLLLMGSWKPARAARENSPDWSISCWRCADPDGTRGVGSDRCPSGWSAHPLRGAHTYRHGHTTVQWFSTSGPWHTSVPWEMIHFHFTGLKNYYLFIYFHNFFLCSSKYERQNN